PRPPRRLRPGVLGPVAGRQPSRRSQRVGRRRSGRQRLGVDEHLLRSLPGVPAAGYLSGIFHRFLRRRSLRPEGGLAGDGAGPAATDVPQLVPRALPVRLRDVPMRPEARMTPTTLTKPVPATPAAGPKPAGRAPSVPAPVASASAPGFAADVRHF